MRSAFKSGLPKVQDDLMGFFVYWRAESLASLVWRSDSEAEQGISQVLYLFLM